jgi:hypothetical protein
MAKQNESYYLDRLNNIKVFVENNITQLKRKLNAHKAYVADNRSGSSANFLPEQDWVATVNRLSAYEDTIKFMMNDHAKGGK